MRYIPLLVVYFLVLSENLLATLTDDQYRLCVFDSTGKVNNDNAVDVVLSDGGILDEYVYENIADGSLNWVDVQGISSNSVYSEVELCFARIKRKLPLSEPASKDGTLKLKFNIECNGPNHVHPNDSVYCRVLCLYDETGNDTSENALREIYPQYYWNGLNSEDCTSYSSGILWHTNWHGFAYKDIDVWKLKGLEEDKIYCLEVKTLQTDQSDLKLEIIQNSDTKTLDEQNVFDQEGEKDRKTYRIYFCAKSSEAFARISFDDFWQLNNTRYKIALMKCKAVVLVHGLGGHPTKSGGFGTDFEDLRDFIGYINNVRPCVCLEFPWNPGVGSYKDYVGLKSQKGTLCHYLYESNSFFHSKATIMTYSTGGTILYDQITYNNDLDKLVQNAVIVASPFWGVHVAKTTRSKVTHYLGLNWFFGSSYKNQTDLSRGSKINWDRHFAKPCFSNLGNISIVVGDGSRTSYRLFVFYANHYGKEINELKDSHRGDGLIAYHSANLKSKHHQVNRFEVTLGHNILVKFKLSDLGKRKAFFKDFIDKINTWECYEE